ncbi:hypothetical protein MSAN_00599800 [Mycena sanguinolenta]|uniref:F-box domain-containing protein n=1 Tax=Mycena sanguinolenta TaxID=230812 RepID=A0A8H6ZBL5_9AGAR|nr:hypothetical protein MSAN_00599800 [Mycena sanguinolenta]
MTFWPVKTLWNFLRPQPSFSLDGRCALPMELWDYIFLHLDNDTLYTVAAVCRPFNERSVCIALLANGVAHSDMAAGNYTVPSRLLPLLLRAFFIPTIKHLSCAFGDSKVLFHLRLVSALVARSSDLDSIDLLLPPFEGVASWYRLRDDPHHRKFCTILAAMLSGPWPWRDIIFVSKHHFVRCSTQDLFRYLGQGGPGPCIRIEEITSWKLYFRRTRADGLRPFTMLIVNESTTNNPFETLTLGFRPWFSPSDESRLSVTHLNIMLTKLTLPHLQDITILRSHIDPTTLRDFLIRHPQIRYITDARPQGAKKDAPSPRNALFHPPLAMPNLRRIEGETAVDVLSLLVLTVPSLPCTISFAFQALPGEAEARASLFHYISLRNIPTELEINSAIISAELTETDFALAQTLHCVEAVSFTNNREIKDPPPLFLWLNSLPALSQVGIVTEHPDSQDLAFLTLARVSLARPGIDLRVEIIPPPREPRYWF